MGITKINLTNIQINNNINNAFYENQFGVNKA